MEDLKCKKGNMNKDPLIRQRKKVRKKTRKKSRKENGKFEGTLNSLEQLFSQISKPGVRKGPGRLRVKEKQRLEGMFIKGLRSEYITREALNEANEARKNEDINKIIDLGRNFLRKDERRGGHQAGACKFSPNPTQLNLFPIFGCSKRISGCDNRKAKKSTVELGEISTDGVENFERCSLSPISFDYAHDQTEVARTSATKVDLEKEFQRFSLKYEEAVGTQVLLKLPQQGILEDAFRALRKKRERERNEYENDRFMERETHFVDEMEEEVPGAEDLIENFTFLRKCPNPETRYYGTCSEKPLENLLIMNDVKADYNHPSFTTEFDNGDEEDQKRAFWFQKGFKKSVKELNVTTPPIQFYRRNMF